MLVHCIPLKQALAHANSAASCVVLERKISCLLVILNLALAEVQGTCGCINQFIHLVQMLQAQISMFGIRMAIIFKFQRKAHGHRHQISDLPGLHAR